MDYRQLAVSCPWCPDSKHYRRAVDLRQHANADHLEMLEGTPDGILSENNCYWVAKFPDTYASVINPTKADSLEAQAVTKLLHKKKQDLVVGSEQEVEDEVELGKLVLSSDNIKAVFNIVGGDVGEWYEATIKPETMGNQTAKLLGIPEEYVEKMGSVVAVFPGGQEGTLGDADLADATASWSPLKTPDSNSIQLLSVSLRGCKPLWKSTERRGEAIGENCVREGRYRNRIEWRGKEMERVERRSKDSESEDRRRKEQLPRAERRKWTGGKRKDGEGRDEETPREGRKGEIVKRREEEASGERRKGKIRKRREEET
ncbi:hypothetical protein LOTGIDRAFT_171631 [Lottia gigantea]|uniref:Uncharacterized protein n=1 Tax=Lottia gigantea TaxID=225164 RepID=V4CLU5_LOTGI|nr:hypothetical protein LOTGIDRAFT_171631 [Lottia gigantea]ESP03285.1 hypothetical protein LOTGIDRAFT_171631 [Lottia gigantea]